MSGPGVLLHFLVPGDPVQKERPRKGQHGTIYTPRESLRYEDAVGWAFRQAYPDVQPDRLHNWRLTVTFYLTSQRGRDGSNLLKGHEDGLNRLVWWDDQQVMDGRYLIMLGVPEPWAEVVCERLEPRTKHRARRVLGGARSETGERV